jgi:acetyltransferase-like isoleucine patch superfamily enzyme
MESIAPGRPQIQESTIKDVDFGSGVRVIKPTNLYGCRIGDNSFIGPFVEIQRGAAIGRDCRVQSHAFICELVTIGNECFIGHGVMFINDSFENGGPARGDRTKWRSTFVGDNVSIGSNATILPVRIVGGAVIGAGAVVTRDINVRGVYAGNPAKMLRTL